MPSRSVIFALLLSLFPIHPSLSLLAESRAHLFPNACQWKEDYRSATGRIIQPHTLPVFLHEDSILQGQPWPVSAWDGISPRSEVLLSIPCRAARFSFKKLVDGEVNRHSPFSWLNRDTGKPVAFTLLASSSGDGQCLVQARPSRPLAEASRHLFVIHSHGFTNEFQWLDPEQLQGHQERIDQCAEPDRLRALVKKYMGVHSRDLHFAMEFGVRSESSALGPLLYYNRAIRQQQPNYRNSNHTYHYWQTVAGKRMSVVEGSIETRSMCTPAMDDCRRTQQTRTPPPGEFELQPYTISFKVYIPDTAFRRPARIVVLSDPAADFEQNTNSFLDIIQLSIRYGLVPVVLTDPYYSSGPAHFFHGSSYDRDPGRVVRVFQRMIHEQVLTEYLRDQGIARINKKYERELIQSDRAFLAIGREPVFSQISLHLNGLIMRGLVLDSSGQIPATLITEKTSQQSQNHTVQQYRKMVFDPIHQMSYARLLQSSGRLSGTSASPRLFRLSNLRSNREVRQAGRLLLR